MVPVDSVHPVHLIINPASGGGAAKRLLGDLRAEIAGAGYALAEYTTTAPADATRYARSVAEQASAVLVWGGDGTVNEVANGLAGSRVPVLPCPAGTENLLAKEMHVPLRPERIVDILRHGQIVQCDVGRVNDRNWLMIIGVGFDGEVVRRVSSKRIGHISHLSYFWPLWRTFWEHQYPRMTILADGEEIFAGEGLAFVGNISRYAVGLRICRDAHFDDGLIDVVVFRCDTRSRLMLHSAWTLLRRHPLKGNVVYKQARQVQILTDQPVPCQVDGDAGPDTPLRISILPEKLRLLVPRRRQGGWALWPFINHAFEGIA